MSLPLRIQVFCDDTFHPAATARTGLAPLAATGQFAFDWVEDASGWSPDTLQDYPVVLLTKSNVISVTNRQPWLRDGTEHAFRHYARQGGGLVIVHSGTASYAHVAPMRELAGGTFLQHPPPGEVVITPKPGHPLTVGVAGPFPVHDEHYGMALDDPGADVFLHSQSSHGIQPAGWTRTEGRGRVCVLTPGHFPEVWRHPAMQTLISNAINWVTPAGSGG